MTTTQTNHAPPTPESLEARAIAAEEIESTCLQIADQIERLTKDAAAVHLGMFMAAAIVLGARWTGTEAGLLAAFDASVGIARDKMITAFGMAVGGGQMGSTPPAKW